MPTSPARCPTYDALRIFADNSPPDPPARRRAGSQPRRPIYGANVDGEVSVKVTDFPAGDASIDAGIGFDASEVEKAVRAAANFAPEGQQVAALSFVETGGSGDDALGDAASGEIPSPPSAYASSRRTSPTSRSPMPARTQPTGEKIVAVAKGQSFRALLEQNGISRR